MWRFGGSRRIIEEPIPEDMMPISERQAEGQTGTDSSNRLKGDCDDKLYLSELRM